MAEAEVSDDVTVEMHQGHTVTLRELPVRRVGVYVPGGGPPIPLPVVMCCEPARVAGVEQIAVATPPGDDGRASDSRARGLPPVRGRGGPPDGQARRAWQRSAYGTASVAPVDVIVGPGNTFVQEAKRQLVGLVGIDGVAGPTELLVVADAQADPELVALDLAAQAEHGPDTVVAVAARTEGFLDAVEAAAARLAEAAANRSGRSAGADPDG